MGARHVLIAGERMTDQHGIRALRIERAVGLVGDLEGRKLHAGVELERLVGPEMGNERGMRVIRLGRSTRRFTRARKICLDHVA